MNTCLLRFASLAVLLLGGAASSQEPVLGVADPDSLFTSTDQHLNTNKQAAYHIMKDLLEANHWEQADKWLTAQYHQHNPVASGRDGVVKFFMSIFKPPPVPERRGNIRPHGSTCGGSRTARPTSTGAARLSLCHRLRAPTSQATRAGGAKQGEIRPIHGALR